MTLLATRTNAVAQGFARCTSHGRASFACEAMDLACRLIAALKACSDDRERLQDVAGFTLDMLSNVRASIHRDLDNEDIAPEEVPLDLSELEELVEKMKARAA